DGFELLTILFASYDLGLRNLKLVAFAAHHLDDDRKLQLSAPGYFEGVARFGFLDANRNVGESFLIEPLAQFSRSNISSVASRERRSVHAEHHRDRRFIDCDSRERLGIVRG